MAQDLNGDGFKAASRRPAKSAFTVKWTIFGSNNKGAAGQESDETL